MPDTYLEEAPRRGKLVQTLLVHAETALEDADRRLPPGATVTRYGALQIAIEDALPRIEAHYREKLGAALLSDKAKGAAFDAHLNYQVVSKQTEDSWIAAILGAALAAALQPDTKTDERSSKEGA